MSGLLTGAKDLYRLGPREVYRRRVKVPFIELVDNTLEVFKTKAKSGMHSTKDVLIKGSIVAFTTSTLLWLSILMYLAFYYAYVPSISHERQVHLTFQPHDVGLHTNLIAHVELTKRQQLLMMGQAYKVQLVLEVPESPTNKKLGMFMTCADFHSKDGTIIAESCRSSMLHYRSPLLDVMHTMVFSPFYLTGVTEEKQNLRIELFTNYEENMSPTVTDVYIEIQSTSIEIYAAKLSIIAELTGLRYFMFNWPLVSAAIGVSTNLILIAVVCLITWYQLINSEEYKKYLVRKEKVMAQFKESFEPDSYSSSSIEDISMMEKYRDKSSDSDTVEDIKPEKMD